MKKIMLFIGLKLFEFLVVVIPFAALFGLVLLICHLVEKYLSAKIIILSICGMLVLFGIIVGVMTWVKFNLEIMKFSKHPFRDAWERIWH